MDKIIARFFYRCGIPFNVMKSSHCKQIYVVGHYGPRYLPPSYEKLTTTLLKEVKNYLIKDLDVVKEIYKEIGCTITWDGWTSVDNIPLLNILCVCPKGDFFCKHLIQLARQKWQLILLTQFVK
jgi:hypothetical protein